MMIMPFLVCSANFHDGGAALSQSGWGEKTFRFSEFSRLPHTPPLVTISLINFYKFLMFFPWITNEIYSSSLRFFSFSQVWTSQQYKTFHKNVSYADLTKQRPPLPTETSKLKSKRKKCFLVFSSTQTETSRRLALSRCEEKHKQNFQRRTFASMLEGEVLDARRERKMNADGRDVSRGIGQYPTID